MKIKRYKTLIGIIALIGVMVCSVSCHAAGKKEGKAKIHFMESRYDFGTISEKKGAVTHMFEFINDGEGNLVIKDATAECGCTRPEYPQNPIAPGKKGKVKVSFLPAGRRGSFEKTVTIRTNGNPRNVKIKISGNVIP